MQLELARSLAAQKRPRGMTAVAIVAILGVAEMVVFALDRANRADAAALARLQADVQRTDASAKRNAEYPKVGEFESKRNDTQAKLDAALARMAVAEPFAAQVAQLRKIAAQRRAAAQQQARFDKPKADAGHQVRNTKVEITDHGKTHSFAAKCIK